MSIRIGIWTLMISPKEPLVWYTNGNGCRGLRSSISVPMGKEATIFQAKAYATVLCIQEILRREYNNRKIYIMLNNQAPLKSLDSWEHEWRLVWECLQNPILLAEDPILYYESLATKSWRCIRSNAFEKSTWNPFSKALSVSDIKVVKLGTRWSKCICQQWSHIQLVTNLFSL